MKVRNDHDCNAAGHRSACKLAQNNTNQSKMAMNQGLPAPEPLELSSGNISANWKKFRQKYTNYEIATGVSEKESSTRVATLLTVIGNDAMDVYNTLVWDVEGDDKKINKVLTKFDVQHTAKPAITVRSKIISRTCAVQGRQYMDWNNKKIIYKKKHASWELSRLKSKMMNVLQHSQYMDISRDGK